MSQSGSLNSGSVPPSVATIYEGNTGSATPSANHINFLGMVVAAGTDPFTSVAAGNTVSYLVQTSQAVAATDATKIGLAAFDSSSFSVDANGFVTLSGGGEAIDSFIPDSGTSPVVPNGAGQVTMAGLGSITTVGGLNSLSIQLTGLTNHSVLVGAGTTTITNLAVGSNGQVLIGATAANPAFATLTSSDSSISFTTGANTLSLQVAGGTTVGKTITGDSGGALSPTAGNWNILGSGSITTSGAASTLTVQLQNLTNHAVLVGAGTTTITKIAATANTGAVLQNNAGADPSYSTATYPSTTTINQILYSSANNVVAGLATANRAVLTTGTTGVPVLTALATDGQLIIGSTAGVPAAATLSQGSGITITNGSNSITIAANPTAWTDESGAFAPAESNGYFITGTSTATLPASPSQGNTISFACDTTNVLTIQANTGQTIRIGATVSSSAGTRTSTARGDSVTLVYRSSDTSWIATSSIGNWGFT